MRTERLEGLVQVLILIAIAGMAGAASFTHVHNWTMGNAPHGTGSWFGWANAVISELTPTAAGIEIRRRKRNDRSVAYPMAILIAAAALSLSAQVAEARPTFGGWVSSAVPALAFLALTKLVLSRSPEKKEDTQCAETAPKPAAPAGNSTMTTVTAPATMTTSAPAPAGPNPAGPPLATSTGMTPAAGSKSPSENLAPSASSSPAPPALTPEILRELQPVPSGQLLMSARMAAFAYQQETGQPVTTGELAARMKIPPALAESVLDHLGGTTAPPPVTAASGTVINGSRP
jgi:hypothetical protein